MFIFIDESGDPGFKFHKGSSDVFTMAMVVSEDSASCEEARQRIRYLSARHGFRTEFKFSKSRPEIRDEFFSCLAGSRFSVRGLVVQKSQLPAKPRLLRKESFYEYFLRVALQRCCSGMRAAQIVIDGAADRTLQQKLRLVVSASAGQFRRKITTRDSRSDELLQLADMAAGAIARAYRSEDSDRRWLAMLERNGQLGEVHRY